MGLAHTVPNAELRNRLGNIKKRLMNKTTNTWQGDTLEQVSVGEAGAEIETKWEADN